MRVLECLFCVFDELMFWRDKQAFVWGLGEPRPHGGSSARCGLGGAGGGDGRRIGSDRLRRAKWF